MEGKGVKKESGGYSDRNKVTTNFFTGNYWKNNGNGSHLLKSIGSAHVEAVITENWLTLEEIKNV